MSKFTEEFNTRVQGKLYHTSLYLPSNRQLKLRAHNITTLLCTLDRYIHLASKETWEQGVFLQGDKLIKVQGTKLYNERHQPYLENKEVTISD